MRFGDVAFSQHVIFNANATFPAPNVHPLHAVRMYRFILLSTWILSVAVGSYLLMGYELAPGEQGTPPDLWPKNAHVSSHPDKPTLVMFVHPQCPCTRASLSELSILLAKCQGLVRTYVLLVQPDGVADDWVQTDLLEQAKQIPGVTVLPDVGGVLADQFDARTSGETLLYDRTGQRRFRGGITSSRGHHGASDGRRSIVEWVLYGVPNKPTAPVFGCPLQNNTTTNNPPQPS